MLFHSPDWPSSDTCPVLTVTPMYEVDSAKLNTEELKPAVCVMIEPKAQDPLFQTNRWGSFAKAIRIVGVKIYGQMLSKQ